MKDYLGEVFVLAPPRRDGEWTHGICVGVTRTKLHGSLTWIRLKFPDHSEKSYRPSRLRHAIPWSMPT